MNLKQALSILKRKTGVTWYGNNSNIKTALNFDISNKEKPSISINEDTVKIAYVLDLANKFNKKADEFEDEVEFDNIEEAIQMLMEWSGDMIHHGFYFGDEAYKEVVDPVLKKMKQIYTKDEITTELAAVLESLDAEGDISVGEIKYWAKMLGVNYKDLI